MPPSPITVAILLVALARGEMNAYAIVQQVKQDSHGNAMFADRSIYYALERLLAKGLIGEGPMSEPQRRIYQLKERGRRVLRSEFVRMQYVTALLRERIG